MVKRSFEEIVRALNEASVPFIVVGGLAVNAHGYGRVTFDIDIVIRLDPVSVRNAFLALEGIGYRPAVPVTAEQFGEAATREMLRESKGMIVLKFWSNAHRQTPIDMFVTEPFDFSGEYEAALVEELAPGLFVRMLRYETLIAMKKSAGRSNDLADIRELEFLRTGRYED